MKEIETFFNHLIQESASDEPTGKHEPRSALAYVSRGYAHLAQANAAESEAQRLREFRQALENWNRAIDIGLHTVPAIMKTVEADLYYGLSLNLLHALNDQRQDIDDFTRVIRMAPRYVKAYISRGEAYAKLGTYQHAVDDFTKAIDLGATTATVYEHRGRAYEKLSRYDLAANDFTSAIERNPDGYFNYYSRANAYRLLGRIELAVADYRKVIEMGHTSGLAKLARERLNELAQGVQEMEKRKPRKAKRWFW